MDNIERVQDLEWLHRWKEKQIIKVVTGVRRCGKSTLFEMFQKDLLASGVQRGQIHAVNFEDLEYEDHLDYRSLYRDIRDRLVPDRMNYIFLDEIQHVDQYQKAVDSLFLRENCDVYITGSGAADGSAEFISGKSTLSE